MILFKDYFCYKSTKLFTLLCVACSLPFHAAATQIWLAYQIFSLKNTEVYKLIICIHSFGGRGREGERERGREEERKRGREEERKRGREGERERGSLNKAGNTINRLT